jgi:hypothetical protein
MFKGIFVFHPGQCQCTALKMNSWDKGKKFKLFSTAQLLEVLDTPSHFLEMLCFFFQAIFFSMSAVYFK